MDTGVKGLIDSNPRDAGDGCCLLVRLRGLENLTETDTNDSEFLRTPSVRTETGYMSLRSPVSATYK